MGLLRATDLVPRPMVRDGERKRWVYVTPEVADRLDNDEEIFPRASAEFLFTSFSLGHLITVSRSRDNSAALKRMVGPDEVWVMCFRNPRPGGRLLGRFFGRDIFVGLSLNTREELGGRLYEECAAQTIARWDERFRSSRPVRSDDLADYLSPHFRDMDDEEY